MPVLGYIKTRTSKKHLGNWKIRIRILDGGRVTSYLEPSSPLSISLACSTWKLLILPCNIPQAQEMGWVSCLLLSALSHRKKRRILEVALPPSKSPFLFWNGRSATFVINSQISVKGAGIVKWKNKTMTSLSREGDRRSTANNWWILSESCEEVDLDNREVSASLGRAENQGMFLEGVNTWVSLKDLAI